jgi:hypothetical protein
MAKIVHNRPPQHRGKINLDQAVEVRAWCKHLGVSPDELELAIEKVGDSAAAVRKELATSTKPSE